MKTILFLMFVPIAAFAGEDGPSVMDQVGMWSGLVVLIVEWLLANTKVIKANSMIDMVINMLKMIGGKKDA